MTENEMKLWLNRAFYAKKKIIALTEYLNNLRHEITDVSVSYESDGASKSLNADNSTENKYLKYAEVEENINAEISELEQIPEEIRAKIKLLKDNDLEAVLIHRYINCKTFEQTAEAMNYSVESVKKKNKKAVQELSKLYT